MSNITTAIDNFTTNGGRAQNSAFTTFTSETSGDVDAAAVAKAAGEFTINLARANRILGAAKEASDSYKEAVRNTQ